MFTIFPKTAKKLQELDGLEEHLKVCPFYILASTAQREQTEHFVKEAKKIKKLLSLRTELIKKMNKEPTTCEVADSEKAFRCQTEEQCDDCFMVDHLKECNWCEHYNHPEKND